MVLTDWSKVSGADLQLIKKACHLSCGAISRGSESRYIHNGTGNTFYVSQGMSTWFGLVKPSSGTAKMRVGGIFKYYDNNNYVYSYLEVEIDNTGNIANAKVVYVKREGGSETVVLEDDVTDKIQHLAGMVGYSVIREVDDFEDGTTQGWEKEGDGCIRVVSLGYEGSKSLRVDAGCNVGAGGSCESWIHAYKYVENVAFAHVLCYKKFAHWNGIEDYEHYAKVEDIVPSDDWSWIVVCMHDDNLDVECYAYVKCSSSSESTCNTYSYIDIDTVEYIDYLNMSWAFIKFYGYLKQIEGKWYLDIEVRVSDNYYTNPDTSVEPSTTKISSCLIEIPSAIVGNNTKCGIILGREVSDFRSQSYPNIVIDYTKLFY